MSDPVGAGRLLLVPLGDTARPVASQYMTILETAGHTMAIIDDPAEAVAALAAGDPSVVLLISSGSDHEALAVEILDKMADETPVAVLGVPKGPSRREMILSGALLALEKPTTPGLLDFVDQVLRYSRAITRQATYQCLQEEPSRLLGAGVAIHEAMRVLDRAVESGSPVLVVGEAGVGKNILARILHQSFADSGRPGPYVCCTLGAFEPPRLMEVLLGSASVPGAFERAHQGTLFLDDISRLSPELQVMVQEVIQEGAAAKVRRADDSDHVGADVRIVAGSSSPLDEDVARGRVREDLYYRLRVLSIHLPPIRERITDIPVVADTLVDHFAAQAGKTIVGLSPAAMELLALHDWPGNIREMEKHIKNAVNRSSGPTLDAGDLSELAALLGVMVPGKETGEAERGTLEISIALDTALPMTDMTRRASAVAEVVAIRRALALTCGNVTHAARILGISRIHLQKRMKAHGLRDEPR